MAKKSYGRRRGPGSGGAFKNGKYRFTAKRRYALQRAAYISARKRKNNHAATAKRVAVIAGVAGAAYFGFRNRETIGRTTAGWKNAVQPWNKERNRINNAISVADPSQTTVITAAGRQRAKEIMKQLEEPLPDRRIYDENDDVDTEAMTEQSVKRTLGRARRRSQGKKTGSLTGTPGGTKTPAKANPANTPKEDEWGATWIDDILVPISRTRMPAITNLGGPSSQMPGRTRPSSSTGTRMSADPMRSLEGMRAADERLLSGKDKPDPSFVGSGVAPVEFRAPVMDKPAPARSKAKPKAPTTNPNTTKDARPNPGPKGSSSVEHRKRAAEKTSSGDQEVAINALVDNNPGMSREEAHDRLYGYPGNYRKWW